MSDKRLEYISWDDYFMGVALLAAQRSKDPNTQVGACIVDGQNRILSTGYIAFLAADSSAAASVPDASTNSSRRLQPLP